MSNAISVNGIDFVYEVEDSELFIVTVSDNSGPVACMSLDHSCESAGVEYISCPEKSCAVRYFDFVDRSAESIAEWLAATSFD